MARIVLGKNPTKTILGRLQNEIGAKPADAFCIRSEHGGNGPRVLSIH